VKFVAFRTLFENEIGNPNASEPSATMKFVALRTLIENEIGNPATNDASSTRMRALVQQWANAVYREIGRRHDWSWLEDKEVLFTLSAGTGTYTLPSYVNKVLEVFDLSATVPTLIPILPDDQFWVDGGVGVPTSARIYGGKIELNKKPTADRNYQFRCKLAIAELNATDNSGLGTEILMPSTDIDAFQDGIRAYWTRYRLGSGHQDTRAEFKVYQEKTVELIQKDKQGPGMRKLILQWANDVYREIGRKRTWSWLEETEDEFTLAEGEDSYAIPAIVNKVFDLFDLGYNPAR